MQTTFVLRDETNARRLWAFLKANWVAKAQAGAPLSISIGEHKARRSTEQNKKLHAMFGELEQSAWLNGQQYSAEVWKEFVRRKFIGVEEIDLPDGTRIDRGISTTALSVHEFSELIEQVHQWAADDLGVELT